MPTTELPDLARTRLRTRRWVLRHRRGLAAVLLGVATVAALRTLAPAPPDQVELLVAATDLSAGTQVSADDVTTVAVPSDAVPEGAHGRAEVVGRTLAGPLRRGEPVTDAGLVVEGMLAGYPGLVALPVRIPDPDAVEMLRAGDRIDLVATDPASGAATQVASGAHVITVPRTGSSTPTAGQALPGRLVVLAVTPTAARNIAGAATTRYLSVMISG